STRTASTPGTGSPPSKSTSWSSSTTPVRPTRRRSRRRRGLKPPSPSLPVVGRGERGLAGRRRHPKSHEGESKMAVDERKAKMADPEFLIEIGMATIAYNDQTVHHAATLAEAAMQIALEEMRRGRTDQAVEHLRLALDQLTAALDGEEWTIWDTIDSGKRGFDTFLDEINEAKTPTFAYWFDGLFSGKITAGTPELGAYLARLL